MMSGWMTAIGILAKHSENAEVCRQAERPPWLPSPFWTLLRSIGLTGQEFDLDKRRGRKKIGA